VHEGAGIDAEGDATYDQPHYWWHARYRLSWSRGTLPDWPVDLLLAHAVIKPTLLSQRQNIRYWRFHRRAAPDEAGHQFSFIFYSDRDTAEKIYQSILDNELTKKLVDKNIISAIVFDDPADNLRVNVEDASDKNWPSGLQKAWPAYIMGVSSMWLHLIDQEVGGNAASADVDELLKIYRQANERITGLWQKEGQHAFLHHLNALFGYEPILIERSIQF
jgi:hypothetical protein